MRLGEERIARRQAELHQVIDEGDLGMVEDPIVETDAVTPPFRQNSRCGRHREQSGCPVGPNWNRTSVPFALSLFVMAVLVTAIHVFLPEFRRGWPGRARP